MTGNPRRYYKATEIYTDVRETLAICSAVVKIATTVIWVIANVIVGRSNPYGLPSRQSKMISRRGPRISKLTFK